MATWGELSLEAPQIAAVGRALLDRHRLAYLATVRADGAPRVHPVSPFIVDGRLLVATPRSSPKARDQLRDGRVVIHMPPGENDDEFRVRCRARSIEDGADRARTIASGPGFVHDDDYIFEYDIDEAATAYWVDVGQPGTYPVRRSWKADST